MKTAGLLSITVHIFEAEPHKHFKNVNTFLSSTSACASDETSLYFMSSLDKYFMLSHKTDTLSYIVRWQRRYVEPWSCEERHLLSINKSGQVNACSAGVSNECYFSDSNLNVCTGRGSLLLCPLMCSTSLEAFLSLLSAASS